MTARDPILIPADAAPDLALALADHAVAALIDEAMLTPKPGLVDLRGAGAHRDLSWPYAEQDVTDATGRWGVGTSYANVYLCGAGAVRGGGVSGVPGHNAAMAVLEKAR